MAFSVGSGNGDEEYFYPSDSAYLRSETVSDLTDDFNGHNNITLTNDTDEYTLKITSCSFDEWVTNATVVNPCDSSPFPDSLHYQLHHLLVSMYCTLTDHAHHSFVLISANAGNEEDLKDGPTFFQSLFDSDNCQCYEPHVKAIHFYGQLRRTVLRLIHIRAVNQLLSWQAM